MIYLIGGPPRCGKTTLAMSLGEKRSIPYVSIDHVSSVITPYLPKAEYATLLPLRVTRAEVDNSNDAFYAKYSPQEITAIYVRQAETLWPGVESFIRYALGDSHDLILEGGRFSPDCCTKPFRAGCLRHLTRCPGISLMSAVANNPGALTCLKTSACPR